MEFPTYITFELRYNSFPCCLHSIFLVLTFHRVFRACTLLWPCFSLLCICLPILGANLLSLAFFPPTSAIHNTRSPTQESRGLIFLLYFMAVACFTASSVSVEKRRASCRKSNSSWIYSEFPWLCEGCVVLYLSSMISIRITASEP